jgi:hypothetical protein
MIHSHNNSDILIRNPRTVAIAQVEIINTNIQQVSSTYISVKWEKKETTNIKIFGK